MNGREKEYMYADNEFLKALSKKLSILMNATKDLDTKSELFSMVNNIQVTLEEQSKEVVNSEENLKREIRVDFYKESGKWYAGGNVLVKHYLFQDGFRQDIVNNQQILHDGWQGNYIVVTDDLDDSNLFSKQVFLPSRFVGIHKRN